MKRNILAVCDLEKGYVKGFKEYLEKVRELPFDVEMFTDTTELRSFCEKESPELILISEAAYEEEIKELGQVIILNESGFVQDSDIYHVDKYQPADHILREVMVYYMERPTSAIPKLLAGKQSKLIGIYSPVKRCLQTSTALTMGQVLAREHKVLYISFENYSGFGKLMDKEFSMDLVDLVYYMKHAKERLVYRLGSMVQTVNGLDFIPPAVSFQDLNAIAAEEWLILFEELGKCSEYEYIILDLSENLGGIFDILMNCDYIYTIVKNDGMSYAKICQYEELLVKKEYEDILERTRKINLPYFKHLPGQVEQLLYSELADYVKQMIAKDGL